MEKRLAWLDLAKLAAMFLVIYNHLGIADEHVRMWISSFHVPAFFFISGMFIKPRTEFGLQKNVCQLLVPTVLWFLILWVSYNVVVTKIQHPGNFLHNWLELFTGFFAGTTSGSGWFLIALFWIRLLLWRIILLPKKHQPWVVALVTGLGVYLSRYPELNRYHIVNALTALPFTYMGYLMASFLLRTQVKRGRGVAGIVALMAVTVALSEFNGNVGSLSMEMGHYWWLSYLQGFLGAMLLLLVCNLLREWKVLSMGGGKNAKSEHPATLPCPVAVCAGGEGGVQETAGHHTAGQLCASPARHPAHRSHPAGYVSARCLRAETPAAAGRYL